MILNNNLQHDKFMIIVIQCLFSYYIYYFKNQKQFKKIINEYSLNLK